MSFNYFDRVKESSTTTGTGNISLGGAISGFITFSSVFSNGSNMYYCIADQSASNWEVGVGTYNTSGNTLSRTTVLASSNSGSKVNFTSMSLFVFCTAAALGQGVAPAAITGLLPTSISGTNTTAAITVASGIATDSNNIANMRGVGYSWAASNGNHINGTDAVSSTLANSTTYHMFLCSGSSGTGTFTSASLTPTFPTGYVNFSRRIFSFNTDVSGNPISYIAVEVEGGSYIAWLTTQILDVGTTVGSGGRTLCPLTVPTGIRVVPLGRLSGPISGGTNIILTSGDETDVASPSSGDFDNGLFNNSPGYDACNVGSVTALLGGQPYLTTDTSGQIGARSNGTTVIYWVTRGFKDWRRS